MSAAANRTILFQRAWAARENAYAPYSKFSVGAALLTASGEIFPGSNIENISFGLTICAERVAASVAIQAGDLRFTAIAIVADTVAPIPPCGSCRQFLAEFNPSLMIYSAGRAGEQMAWSLSDLLPMPLGAF